jgi:multidrug resistance efflux pump
MYWRSKAYSPELPNWQFVIDRGERSKEVAAMRRNLIVIIALIMLAGLSYIGYSSLLAPSQAPTPTPENDASSLMIWASGEVLPVEWSNLGFDYPGEIKEVLVEEGQKVSKGEVLVRLNDRDFRNALTLAEVGLASAKLELARIQAKARPEEISIAQARVRQGEGIVATAEATVGVSKANLDKLLAGVKPEELDAAAALVAKAEAALKVARAAYDKIAYSDDRGESAEALALENATLDLEEARSNYKALLRGATEEEIAATKAEVKVAEAGLMQAKGEWEMAKATLDLLLAGASKEQIEIAKAGVELAQKRLDIAQSDLETSQLIAPFSGTVGTISGHPGETIDVTVPVLTLGNLDHLRIETKDLRETDITKVHVGQKVDITLDALPNVTLKGHVLRIAPKASTEQGGTNYRVVVEMDETHPELRWGMTAFVNIPTN